MHSGQQEGHPSPPHYRLYTHGSHDSHVSHHSKDVVSTSNKLEDNKEENNEDDEDMFDRVSGCLQEREAATFGAGSAPDTAAPETADWPAPGPCQPTPCFCNSGSAHEGDAVYDAAMCTCCWL